MIDAVLEYVNEVRAEYGKPPLASMPKGKRGNPSNCPVARALETETIATCFIAPDSQGAGVLRDHPRFVTEFIVAFDRGLIPAMEE